MSAEELAEFVAASCERQGVPVKVTDAQVVSRVAALLTGSAGRAESTLEGVAVGPVGEASGTED